MRVKLVEWGNGNTASIVRAFGRVGAECVVVREAAAITGPEPLVIGGVGCFDDAMKRLSQSGMKSALIEAVGAQQTPVLGICLGMQLLTLGSEEGAAEGLSLIDAQTVRFIRPECRLPIPHIGWNTVTGKAGPDILSGRIESFYFNHAFHVAALPAARTAICDYGYPFCAAFQQGHIYGVQFHPEKSRAAGDALLAQFAALSIFSS